MMEPTTPADPLSRVPADDGTASSGAGRLGRPVLTTADAVGQAMAVGPVQAAGFQAFLVAGAAGAATPFVIALATVGALSLAWAVSLYGRRYAGAGMFYEYIARRFGQVPGIGAAGAYLLGALVLIPGAAVATVAFWQEVVAQITGSDPGLWPTAVPLILVITGVAYLGVRLSVRTQLTLTVVSAIPFVALVGVVVAQGGEAGNTLAVFGSAGAPRGDIFRGVLLAVLLFSGFEMAAAVGEETRHPHRSIPRAMLLTVVLSGAFLIAVAYAATIGFGPGDTAWEWGRDPAALIDLGVRYLGEPMAGALAVGLALDLLAVGVAATNGLARVVFALARDGLLPSRLAAVSHHGTPVAGILFVSSAGLLGLVIATPMSDPFDLLRAVSVSFTPVLALIYLVVVAGAFRFVARWQAVLLVPAAALAVLALAGGVSPRPTGPQRVGLWLAVAVLAVVAVWVATLWARHRTLVTHAAEYTLVGPADRDPG